MPKRLVSRWKLALAGAVGLTILLAVTSCTGAVGPAGPAGPSGTSGTSSGVLSGKVTNSLTQGALSGVAVKVTADPSIPAVTLTSGNDGTFSTTLPIGTYTVSFQRANFTTASQTVNIVAGQTSTRDVALVPASRVVVSAGGAMEAEPESTVNLNASVTVMDNSTITAYEWTQVSGVPVDIDNDDSATAQVALPEPIEYKNALLGGLELLDRFMVLGINPHALTAAENAVFKVTVTTSSGKYSANVTVTAKLPYAVTTGLKVVPINVPVLLQGKTQFPYNWSVTGPTGSTAVIDDKTDRNPSFTPDVIGKYTVTEAVSGVSFDVYGGTWTGSITGVDAKGIPISANCTICHNGNVASDKFTDWSATGHAMILADNLNTSTHYGENCFSCHSVGFDKNAVNGGMDDASDYVAFLAAGLINKPSPLNWNTMVANYPMSAQLANIQCENCHGPDNNTIHPSQTLNQERISLSSDVCGACHGEPPRHGRFQQWEESGHGNFELAIDESGRASCARCHTAQGFFAWIAQGDLTKQIQGANGNATAAEMAAIVTKDNAQPITCVVCHDPHAIGTTSGDAGNATVRFSGDTAMLPSGFAAKEVGKGAICITCHNTRNFLHDDTIPVTAYSAPHTAAQGDVLMGQNAYFVEDERSPHSYIDNTCVTCHLNETPPPADYSLAGAGTNHGFSASLEMCGSCHSSTLSGIALQDGVEHKLEKLAAAMGTYLLSKLPDQFNVQDYTPHTFNGKFYDVKSAALVINKSNVASVTPTEPHGQQGFLVKLKEPVDVTYSPAGEEAHTVAMTELEVQLGNFTEGTTPLIATSDVLIKAGWNYFLLEGDGSFGIHNPAFANKVIDATLAALK